MFKWIVFRIRDHEPPEERVLGWHDLTRKPRVPWLASDALAAELMAAYPNIHEATEEDFLGAPGVYDDRAGVIVPVPAELLPAAPDLPAAAALPQNVTDVETAAPSIEADAPLQQKAIEIEAPEAPSAFDAPEDDPSIPTLQD